MVSESSNTIYLILWVVLGLVSLLGAFFVARRKVSAPRIITMKLADPIIALDKNLSIIEYNTAAGITVFLGGGSLLGRPLSEVL